MTETCPYCKAEMKEVPPTSRLSNKQKTVFDMIVGSGAMGLGYEALMEALFQGRSMITLRSCIHNINSVIHPLYIKGRGGRYYLKRDEEGDSHGEIHGTGGD